jgi:hypothetical protein
MNSRTFIRNHITAVSIIIYIVVFCLVQAFKPGFIYNEDGSLKQFGLGVRQKTVIPIWLIALILAIFSYLFVLYYLAMPKFRF